MKETNVKCTVKDGKIACTTITGVQEYKVLRTFGSSLREEGGKIDGLPDSGERFECRVAGKKISCTRTSKGDFVTTEKVEGREIEFWLPYVPEDFITPSEK